MLSVLPTGCLQPLRVNAPCKKLSQLKAHTAAEERQGALTRFNFPRHETVFSIRTPPFVFFKAIYIYQVGDLFYKFTQVVRNCSPHPPSPHPTTLTPSKRKHEVFRAVSPRRPRNLAMFCQFIAPTPTQPTPNPSTTLQCK